MLLVADTLSRSPLSNTAHEFECEDYTCNILYALNPSWKNSNKTQAVLIPPTSYTLQCARWMARKEIQCPSWSPAIWNIRDENFYHYGIVFKGSNVVIPATMHLAVQSWCKLHILGSTDANAEWEIFSSGLEWRDKSKKLSAIASLTLLTSAAT